MALPSSSSNNNENNLPPQMTPAKGPRTLRHRKRPLTSLLLSMTVPSLPSCPGTKPNRRKILEALNFLHTICKLIHRNLSPANILVAANDNWKLSGLEFAVRFESTTISESASIMAQETGVSFAYAANALANPSGAALRRQRTLVSVSPGPSSGASLLPGARPWRASRATTCLQLNYWPSPPPS